MASLCISPVQAGIRPLRTANSSFILDRRRRSMRLCAVFRAIFRPAALVADGCFFFPPVPDPPPAVAFLFEPLAVAVVLLLLPLLLFLAVAVGVVADDDDVSDALDAFFLSSWTRGFIWMILRDRVGGGGRENASFCCRAAEERLLDFTVSLGCMGNGALGDGGDILWEAAPESIAEGGSSKDICSEDSCFVLSWTLISVDDAGVGSIVFRGIL